jgi:hypothetical protein
MRNTSSILALVAILPGCATTVTTSSRSYLGPAQSGAVTARSADDTALEVTRLFATRGFSMIDQHTSGPASVRVLKFAKGNRALAAIKDDGQPYGSRDVGSVFYAWITPSGGGSTVALLGKPTLEGIEPCTDDGVALPCTTLEVASDFAATYLSGRVEAEITHGVLSELALEGYAIGPLPVPPSPSPSPSSAECKAARQRILRRVNAEPDPEKRGELLHSLRPC